MARGKVTLRGTSGDGSDDKRNARAAADTLAGSYSAVGKEGVEVGDGGLAGGAGKAGIFI